MFNNDERTIPSYYPTLKELCYHICSSLREEEIKDIVKSAVREIGESKLNSSIDSIEDTDEFTLAQNIEKQLVSLGKQKDIAKFRHLHKKLCHSNYHSLLTNREGVLSFFLNVSEKKHVKRDKIPVFQKRSYISSSNKYYSTSSALKGGGDTLSDSSILSTNGDNSGQNSFLSRPTTLSNNVFIRRDAGISKSPSRPILVQNHNRTSSFISRSASDTFVTSPQYSKYKKNEVSSSAVIKELLFCFQGIEGALLKLDHNLGFNIDPQVRVPQCPLVERLMELGFLHNNIVNQCKSLEKGGSVAQAILIAIRQKLIDFYGFIGSFHSEYLKSSKTTDDTPLREYGCDDNSLTLRKLSFLTEEPMQLLQAVCDALNAVRNINSGTATTALDHFRHHGDERYRDVITSLIIHAGRPIINMIINWMVEGELFDPYNEFFISLNTNCHDRDIWRDKFVLRQDLIPNVMSEKQAHMILRSGKAVNFLNVICEKKTPIVGARERLHNMKDVNILDLTDPRSKLSETILAIFEETSKQVLDTLVNEFKLFQHFQGLRRYILLGQGDFVNYYMELVEPEMRKPASKLQFHELMSLKSSAERATLARYEDPEILNRVSVKLLVASGGDWGSDVFGLQYIMHDPLDAALKIKEGAYSHMFNFLWRTKRMEYILLSLRKERWANKNSLNWLSDRVPEINGVLVLADRLSHELLHFAQHFHYYILFEVVECLWEKFQLAFTKAKSFDDVIKAHDEFIIEMQIKTFQDKDSRTFINELRLVWDLVFELESLEETFCCHVAKEYALRVEREEHINIHGSNHELETVISQSNRKFSTFLSSTRAQYNILNRNYQDVLKKFLLELSSSNKHELRMLSSRIDYSGYYKKMDIRLTESMKYSRCSDLFN
ncbi:unnamed protein product [Nezara viridula]|uniref:Gamma-tubulin complex component n=1 Tax=Nezara viridula TaxID=85310 RepID=A0A9P0HGV7_NEZVI|nr:unnamed protein product [Nezara viridula]